MELTHTQPTSMHRIRAASRSFVLILSPYGPCSSHNRHAIFFCSQARGGLEALASAPTPRGFAPRDGSGGLAGTGGTDAVTSGVGGVRIAAGPPPVASTEAGTGGGLGRWERERESRASSSDKRKVRTSDVGVFGGSGGVGGWVGGRGFAQPTIFFS